jgi:hypothetical protein
VDDIEFEADVGAGGRYAIEHGGEEFTAVTEQFYAVSVEEAGLGSPSETGEKAAGAKKSGTSFAWTKGHGGEPGKARRSRALLEGEIRL